MLLAVGVGFGKAQAQQTFFEDQFDGSSLDTDNRWSFYGASAEGGDGNVDIVTGANGGNGGTNFGFKPTIESDPDGTRYARLRMDTYNSNPRRPGTLKGTEMFSRVGFGPPSDAPRGRVYSVKDQPDEISTGFEFEARIRYVDNVSFPQKGGVAAFWTYWNHSSDYDVKSQYYKAHEIDYEMFYQSSYSNRRLNLQNYRDFNATGSNPYSNPAKTAHAYPPYAPDWKQWKYVKIKWTPLGNGEWRTEWFIKDQPAQNYESLGSEQTIAPNKWMTVRFNIWGHTNSGDIQPTSASNNQSYFLDVDWVKVSKFAAVSASVTEVGGVAVSPSATTTVPNLSIVRGQVASSSGTVSTINAVIRRLSDNTKWKGYADGNGPAGWVPDSQNVGISTDNAQPNWTTNGPLPSGSNLTASDYQISADALSGGTYVSSPVVTVHINSNATPASQSFGPVSGSTNVGDARASNAIYFDADGSNDIAECAIELRQGNVATTAFYNRNQNKLYLSDGNGGRTGGFAPLSANVISNSFVSLNCAGTDIFVSAANKQVQVRWNFTPKAPLAGTNNVNLDVTDQAGAHAGFVNKATWNVVGAPTGNSAPVAVAFTPASGSSQAGNPYGTRAVYSDANGTGDLKYLIVAIVKGSQQTRARYDVNTNLLYLQNDAGQYVGGVAPGANTVISNSLVKLDCSLTSIFVTTDARNQVYVNWRFVAQSGLAGVNDIYLLAFDVATASSGFPKLATWTVSAPSAAISAFSAPAASNTKTSGSPKKTDSAENPYLGEVPGGDTSKNLPKKNTSDGSQEPPAMEIPSSNDSSSAATQKSPPNPSASAS